MNKVADDSGYEDAFLQPAASPDMLQVSVSSDNPSVGPDL